MTQTRWLAYSLVELSYIACTRALFLGRSHLVISLDLARRPRSVNQNFCSHLHNGRCQRLRDATQDMVRSSCALATKFSRIASSVIRKYPRYYRKQARDWCAKNEGEVKRGFSTVLKTIKSRQVAKEIVESSECFEMAIQDDVSYFRICQDWRGSHLSRSKPRGAPPTRRSFIRSPACRETRRLRPATVGHSRRQRGVRRLEPASRSRERRQEEEDRGAETCSRLRRGPARPPFSVRAARAARRTPRFRGVRGRYGRCGRFGRRGRRGRRGQRI